MIYKGYKPFFPFTGLWYNFMLLRISYSVLWLNTEYEIRNIFWLT